MYRNTVPQGQVPFVELLGFDRLNGNITYGSSIYGPEDIQEVVRYLLNTNLA